MKGSVLTASALVGLLLKACGPEAAGSGIATTDSSARSCGWYLLRLTSFIRRRTSRPWRRRLAIIPGWHRASHRW